MQKYDVLFEDRYRINCMFKDDVVVLLPLYGYLFPYNFELDLIKLLFGNQESGFAVNAIDVAVKELIAVATPGEG